VWFVGARGSVATTAMLGAFALARDATNGWGLVTELPEFEALDFVEFDQMVFGGWDVSRVPILDRVRVLVEEDRAISAETVASVRERLLQVEANIKPGYSDPVTNPGDMPSSERLEGLFDRLCSDLDDFARQYRLKKLIVVNLSSTETSVPVVAEHRTARGLRQVIRDGKTSLVTPGVVYAMAALERGYPYVNFTPSMGVNLPGIQEVAADNQVPFYGSDGKSGESLLKTVLAPMFRMRNLEVLSWQGFNILGGGDGQSLNEPGQKRSKVRSKTGVLPGALGYSPDSGVFIEYVPSLGNWKTAWDFVHFRGFLGTKMSLQFTWQGCDSILAAPLVLDLARFTEFAARQGESGPMQHLACFFKDPLDCSVHAFAEQTQMLLDYARRHKKAQG